MIFRHKAKHWGNEGHSALKTNLKRAIGGRFVQQSCHVSLSVSNPQLAGPLVSGVASNSYPAPDDPSLVGSILCMLLEGYLGL